jgi:sugar phosphate isomerase/epimerase
MLIGAMNHPGRPILDEIAWMAEMGLDFIDFTLEPPEAACWRVNHAEIASALRDRNLQVVGHTAYYLPLASPFESLRRAVVEELKQCLDVFSRVGAKWMNLHPDRHVPMHERRFVVQRNLQTIRELLPAARDCGVGLMVENLPGEFNTVAQVGELLDPIPELGLHLDIGHANLLVEKSSAADLIGVYGSRLAHVHLHDNKGGGADLHLPVGAGTIDVGRAIRALRQSGYDGTITLEVFSPDRAYLAYSREVLRRLWRESDGS